MLSHCPLSNQLQKACVLLGKCYPSNAHFSQKWGSKVDCAPVLHIICYNSAALCQSCMQLIVAFQKSSPLNLVGFLFSLFAFVSLMLHRFTGSWGKGAFLLPKKKKVVKYFHLKLWAELLSFTSFALCSSVLISFAAELYFKLPLYIAFLAITRKADLLHSNPASGIGLVSWNQCNHSYNFIHALKSFSESEPLMIFTAENYCPIKKLQCVLIILILALSGNKSTKLYCCINTDSCDTVRQLAWVNNSGSRALSELFLMWHF